MHNERFSPVADTFSSSGRSKAIRSIYMPPSTHQQPAPVSSLNYHLSIAQPGVPTNLTDQLLQSTPPINSTNQPHAPPTTLIAKNTTQIHTQIVINPISESEGVLRAISTATCRNLYQLFGWSYAERRQRESAAALPGNHFLLSLGGTNRGGGLFARRKCPPPSLQIPAFGVEIICLSIRSSSRESGPQIWDMSALSLIR